MTIKTECVIKHLKHDYKEIGKGLGILLAGIACIVILSYGVVILLPYTTGENVLNASAAVLVILSIVPMAVWGSKHAIWSKDSDPKDIRYFLLLLVSISAGICMYGGYAIGVLYHKYPEFPFYSMIAYFVAIFIGVPFSCAVARCRE